MNNKKERMILPLCFMFSYAIGSFYNYLLIGGTILFTGLSSAYYAGIVKRVTYILGLITFCALM